MAKFKVAFELDESDADYFRGLYRKAKKSAADHRPEQIVAGARDVLSRVRASKKTPRFVIEAIGVLADLVDVVQDQAYAAPEKVRNEVLAALAYFTNPEDLIPDHVPGLGFLDDALMGKFIEEEFKHELWGYRFSFSILAGKAITLKMICFYSITRFAGYEILAGKV